MNGIDNVLREALGGGRAAPEPSAQGSFSQSAGGQNPMSMPPATNSPAPFPFSADAGPETNMLVLALTSGNHSAFSRALRRRGLQ